VALPVKTRGRLPNLHHNLGRQQTWSRLKWADKELQAARTRLSNAEQSVRSYTERGRSLLNDMEALVRSLKCEG